jgi:hypothetical protein
VHPVVGGVRPDCCGALMLSVTGRVLAVEADAISHANGLTFRRAAHASGAVPVWNFGRADAIHLTR